MRRIAFLSLAAVLMSACASSGANQLPVTQPCAGHQCNVLLYNHTGEKLSVRYADSTGRRELVGGVAGAERKSIKVQFIHSAGIRLFATRPNGEIWAADLGFEPKRPTEVHFPDDFTLVPDLAMPVRRASVSP